MKEWRVKYDGVCARCGTPLPQGTVAVWDRSTRTMHCVECVPSGEGAPDRRRQTLAVDEGVAGRSARAEYERLAAKRDTAITERWGTGLVAKAVRTLTSKPQSTRAWAIGAAGEEELAAALATVPGLRVLNDRRVRGSPRNIDHVVIAPAGVFVVDAKNHAGTVDTRNDGWLLRPDVRLTVGGRDRSVLADNMAWQVAAVKDALAGVEPFPIVIAVLCFVRADFPLIGAPHEFRGVRVESPRSLRRLVTSTAVLDAPRIEEVTALLAARLPAK